MKSVVFKVAFFNPPCGQGRSEEPPYQNSHGLWLSCLVLRFHKELNAKKIDQANLHDAVSRKLDDDYSSVATLLCHVSWMMIAVLLPHCCVMRMHAACSRVTRVEPIMIWCSPLQACSGCVESHVVPLCGNVFFWMRGGAFASRVIGFDDITAEPQSHFCFKHGWVILTNGTSMVVVPSSSVFTKGATSSCIHSVSCIKIIIVPMELWLLSCPFPVSAP